MKRVKHLVAQAKLHFRVIKQSRQIHDIKPQFTHPNVPYFCQFESRDLVREFLSGDIKTKDDPNWQKSGAQTPKEYASWAFNYCGMDCLKMILASTRKKVIPNVELGKAALKHNVYRLPLDDHPGMFYKPFCEFVKDQFGINATIMKTVTFHDIARIISDGQFFIASVNPAIRYPESIVKDKTGHLILVIGYDIKDRKVTFHNPSGTDKSNQESVIMPWHTFSKFFSHRGVACKM